MRRLILLACLGPGLAVVASAQDAQEAKGPPTLAELLPDESKEGIDETLNGLSPPVERILSRAASRVAKNNQDAKKTNDTVIAEEKKNLEQELDRETKAGLLEQAIATKRLLGAFDEAVMLRAGQKVNKPKPLPLSRDPKAAAVGRWTWPDGGNIELRDNGMAFGSWHGETGLWTVGPDGIIRMMVTKGRGVHEATISPDGKTMAVKGQGIARRLTEPK